MKLLKEHINEKFTEDSDPIHDMGIGLYHEYNFDSMDEAVKFLIKILPSLTKEKDLKKFIDISKSGAYINGNLFDEIWPYIKKYILVKNKYYHVYGRYDNIAHALRVGIITKLQNDKKLLEKFTEDSDPIYDMGIGLKKEIDNWFETYVKLHCPDWAKDDPTMRLHACAYYGKTKYISFLIQQGGDIHDEDEQILRNAAYKLEIETGLELIKYGADLEAAMRICRQLNHPITLKRLNLIKDAYEKTLKESLLEKFSEDSDPIKDMGIGLNKDFFTTEKLLMYVCDNICKILNVKTVPDDLVNQFGRYVRDEYYQIIKEYVDNFLTVQGRNIDINNRENLANLFRLFLEKYKLKI